MQLGTATGSCVPSPLISACQPTRCAHSEKLHLFHCLFVPFFPSHSHQAACSASSSAGQQTKRHEKRRLPSSYPVAMGRCPLSLSLGVRTRHASTTCPATLTHLSILRMYLRTYAIGVRRHLTSALRRTDRYAIRVPPPRGWPFDWSARATNVGLRDDNHGGGSSTKQNKRNA